MALELLPFYFVEFCHVTKPYRYFLHLGLMGGLYVPCVLHMHSRTKFAGIGYGYAATPGDMLRSYVLSATLLVVPLNLLTGNRYARKPYA